MRLDRTQRVTPKKLCARRTTEARSSAPEAPGNLFRIDMVEAIGDCASIMHGDESSRRMESGSSMPTSQRLPSQSMLPKGSVEVALQQSRMIEVNYREFICHGEEVDEHTWVPFDGEDIFGTSWEASSTEPEPSHTDVPLRRTLIRHGSEDHVHASCAMEFELKPRRNETGSPMGCVTKAARSPDPRRQLISRHQMSGITDVGLANDATEQRFRRDAQCDGTMRALVHKDRCEKATDIVVAPMAPRLRRFSTTAQTRSGFGLHPQGKQRTKPSTLMTQIHGNSGEKSDVQTSHVSFQTRQAQRADHLREASTIECEKKVAEAILRSQHHEIGGGKAKGRKPDELKTLATTPRMSGESKNSTARVLEQLILSRNYTAATPRAKTMENENTLSPPQRAESPTATDLDTAVMIERSVSASQTGCTSATESNVGRSFARLARTGSSGKLEGAPPDKYAKMMKMGIPMIAVKNAMIRDGVDPSVLSFGEDQSRQGQQDTVSAMPEKYTKMLKLGIPLMAVRNSMIRDGVDPVVLRATENHETTSDRDSSGKQPVSKDQYRRFRIHWEPHTNVRTNTIWAMVHRDDYWFQELKVDSDEFHHLFRREKSAVGKKEAPTLSASPAREFVVDPKRANNGGIILARVKMSYQDIGNAIRNLEFDRFSLEQLQGLLDTLPTEEEREALLTKVSADGRDSLRTECEKFMLEMLEVPHVTQNIETMLFMKTFPRTAEELRYDASVVKKACDELSSSTRMRKVIGLVLHLGNMLNRAGCEDKPPTKAICTYSLVKLNQSKAFDKHTSFLQYVATVARRNDPCLLNFKDDIPSLCVAEKVVWHRCKRELRSLQTCLDRYEGLNTTEGSPFPRRVLSAFVHEARRAMASVHEEVEAAELAMRALYNYFGEEPGDGVDDDQGILQVLRQFSSDFEASVGKAVERENSRIRAGQKQTSPKFQSPHFRKYVRSAGEGDSISSIADAVVPQHDERPSCPHG